METIRRIIGAARGGLFRHIQPGRLLRAAMPEVFPVTAATALHTECRQAWAHCSAREGVMHCPCWELRSFARYGARE